MDTKRRRRQKISWAHSHTHIRRVHSGLFVVIIMSRLLPFRLDASLSRCQTGSWRDEGLESDSWAESCSKSVRILWPLMHLAHGKCIMSCCIPCADCVGSFVSFPTRSRLSLVSRESIILMTPTSGVAIPPTLPSSTHYFHDKKTSFRQHAFCPSHMPSDQPFSTLFFHSIALNNRAVIQRQREP